MIETNLPVLYLRDSVLLPFNDIRLEFNNERDKKIIIMRYGLNNTEEYTQKEVADILGISQSYISRIEKKVTSDLKKKMKI